MSIKIPTRSISDKELALCLAFQEFLKLVNVYNLKGGHFLYYKEHSVGDLIELKKSIKHFATYEFYKEVGDKIDSSIHKQKSNEKKLNEAESYIKAIKIEIDEAIKKFQRGSTDIKLNLKNIEIEKIYVPKSFIECNFKPSKNSILHNFTQDEIEEFLTTKIKGYTHLNLDQDADWEKIVYFVQNLTDKKEVELKDPESWLRFNMTPQRKTLFELVKKYQYNNDKKHIEEIASLINSDPVVKQLNEKYTKTKIVYRGIASDERLDLKAIIKEDKKRKYISTSPSRYTAEQFAEGRTNLNDEVKSEYSYVVTYTCKPGAVLFSTDLFGRIFGEIDYVLDTSKAKASVSETRNFL